MAEETAVPTTVLLCRDLMFVSKVTATGRATGVAVKVVREPAQLPAEGAKLMVDLNQAGAIEAARVWRERTGGRVIGFVSHVDAETIAAARAAGLDQVLARSRFTSDLDLLLRE